MRTLARLAALPPAFFLIACGADGTSGGLTEVTPDATDATNEVVADTTPDGSDATRADTTSPSDATGDTTSPSDATGDATADTTSPNDATVDTTPSDTTTTECTRLLLSGQLAYDEGSSPDEGYVAFVLDTGDLGFGGELPDQLWIEFYETTEATIDDTGSFDLASPGENDNYATCGQCVSGYIDIDEANETYAGDLYQASGTLVVDASTPPSGGTLNVTLTNLKLIEVTIDPDEFTSTPVAGATCYTISGPVTLTTE